MVFQNTELKQFYLEIYNRKYSFTRIKLVNNACFGS